MKKSPLYVIVILALSSAILMSCQHPVITTHQQQILGKWNTIMGTSSFVFVPPHGTNSKDTTRYAPTDYFKFNADSTVEIWGEGAQHNGKWKIVGNNVVFTGTNYMDTPTTGWPIGTLTANSLVFDDLDTTSPYVTVELKLFLSR